jgi:lipopolysaccharide export system permease protein
MKRYIRYINFQLFMPLVVITVTLTGIIWLTQSLRFIDLIVNRGLGVSTFLYLSSLIIPSLLMISLPVGLYCATVMVYNRLTLDREILVLKSAGLSRMALAKPALIIASTVVIFNYFLSLYLLPVSYREFKDTQIFVRDNYAAVMLQEGVFSNPVQGMTVYIDARQPDGLLKGILVHDTRTPQRPMTLMAQEGRMIQTEFGPRFDMINGNRQEIGENGNLSVLYFDRYAMDISVYAESTTNRVKDEKERFLHELLFPEESLGESMRSKLIVEGHHRLAWPLFCFAVTLIAISALLSGQFNRRGQFRRIVFASVIAASVLVLDLALKNVASSSRLLIPLLYLNPILVSSICLYILLTARINALPFQNILERIKVLSSGKLYWGKG